MQIVHVISFRISSSPKLYWIRVQTGDNDNDNGNGNGNDNDSENDNNNDNGSDNDNDIGEVALSNCLFLMYMESTLCVTEIARLRWSGTQMLNSPDWLKSMHYTNATLPANTEYYIDALSLAVNHNTMV